MAAENGQGIKEEGEGSGDVVLKSESTINASSAAALQNGHNHTTENGTVGSSRQSSIDIKESTPKKEEDDQTGGGEVEEEAEVSRNLIDST